MSIFPSKQSAQLLFAGGICMVLSFAGGAGTAFGQTRGGKSSKAGTDAEAATGVRCLVLENGEKSVGAIRVKSPSVRGACGELVELPSGSYEAELQLDGALDRPKRLVKFQVVSGKVAEVQADFSTASVEVDVRQGVRRLAALVRIETMRGKKVGSLAAGVRGHLSAGTYRVRASYRGKEQVIQKVVLKAGEKKLLRMSFPTPPKGE